METAPPLRPRLAVALLAGAGLVQELLLTRIFSATLYYHFAFLAVSIALLGVAAGGALVQRFAARVDSAGPDAAIAACALGAAVGFPLSLLLALSVPFRPGATPEGVAWIALVYPSLALPFACSGAAIAVALSRLPSPGRVYAFDLLGSAIGCAAFVPLVGALDGPPAGLAAAALAALAAAACGSRRVAVGGACAAAALVGLAIAEPSIGLLRARHRLGREVEPAKWERWNALAQVRVEAPVASRPFGWGMSERFRPEHPIAQARVEIDSGALTVMTGWDGDRGKLEHLLWDVTNAAHHLRPRAKTMVLGVGAGRDVLAALASGSESVTGVEVNDLVLRALTRDFGEFSGHLDRRPGVMLVHDEARSWLARDDGRYDVVMMSLVDTAAASGAGAYALVEDGLYTTEGVRLMLRRLAPRGLVSISRWWFGGPDDRPAQAQRLAALVAAALRAEGAQDPRRHVILLRTPMTGRDPASGDAVVTLLASREPLEASDVAAAERLAARLGFAIVHTPRGGDDGTIEKLLGGEDVALPYDVRPPTDDWPFFFHQLRLSDALATSTGDAGQSSFNLRAVEILALLLVGSCVFTLLFVVAPLARRDARPRPAALLFSALVGLAYMLVELALSQRLSLYLGHPVYALTVVLFVLIGASGAGSLASARLATRALAPIATALVGVLVVTVLALPKAIAATESWPTPARIAISIAALAPAGALMGSIFPLGLAAARERDDRWTPWYWAVNGAASVSGSVVAVASSLAFGISATVLAGAACYALAAVAHARASRGPLSP